VTRLAVAVLCAIGIGISAAAGPGDLVLGAKHAAVEFETVRISKPDGSVVTLRVPRGRPLTLLGSGGGTVLRPQTPDTDRELGLRDPRPAAGAQAGARPDLTPGGGRVSLRAPTGRVDSRVRLSHPYLGTRTIEADLGAMTRGATAAAAPDRRALDDLRDPVVAGDGLAERRAGRGWRPDGDSGKDGGYVLDEFIVLEPGDGWDGPTEEPPPVGEPGDRGYDAKAIARWDVVPYQTITDDFTIGVVAFHINGIEQVLFSVNKGPWAPVKKMQLNPRTNVWEYCVTLRPSLFKKDGPVEVRAVATPKGAGVPRLLEGLPLYLDPAGDFNSRVAYVSPTGNDSLGDGTKSKPFQTIEKACSAIQSKYGYIDGGTVFLMPGDYAAPNGTFSARQTWVTITTAPGVARSAARIVSRGRPKIDLIRFHNLTFVPTQTSLLEGYVDYNRSLWLDGVHVAGSGRYDGLYQVTQRYTPYITDCIYSDVMDGPMGAQLLRNSTIQRIGSDAFQNAHFVCNTVVRDIDRGATGAHPDVYQIYSPNVSVDNRILYNVHATECKSQGLFLAAVPSGEAYTNIAIVNTVIEIEGFANQIHSTAEHIILQNCTFPQGTFVWRTHDVRNIAVTGSVFAKMSCQNADLPTLLSRAHFEDNHYIDANGYGAIAPGGGATDGPAHFTSDTDYRPAPGSPLLARLRDGSPAADALGVARPSPAAVGALEPGTDPDR